MSREQGNRIPPELAAQIATDEPRLNAVPLISTDDRGFPHVALISYFELFLEKGILHLFIGAFSRTARFLEKRRHCTLIFVHRDFVYYVKSRARRRRIQQSQAVFQLQIDSVWEDFPTAEEGDVLLSSGIRFQSPPEETRKRLSLRKSIAQGIQARGQDD